MDLTNLQNIIQGLESFNAHDEIVGIIDSNSDVLVQLEREQLIEGVDKDGNPRNDAYAPMTIRIKEEYGHGPGAITDHVTFYMTGALNESLFYSIAGDEFSFKSPLETYGKMLDRIGDDKFGLDPQQRLFFAEEKLLPHFAEILFQKTTLKL